MTKISPSSSFAPPNRLERLCVFESVGNRERQKDREVNNKRVRRLG